MATTYVPGTRKWFGLYLGWRTVAALFLMQFALFGVNIYALILLVAPISNAFAWSAAESGNLVSAAYLVAPLAIVGPAIVDRLGCRRMLLVGLALQGLALVTLVFLDQYWQFYILRIVMGFGKILAICSMPLLLSPWFSRRFGTAMSIVWAGGSAGGFIVSPITERLIQQLGWEQAALVLGLGVMGCVGVIALLLVSPHSPEEIGSVRDGALFDGDSGDDKNQDIDRQSGPKPRFRELFANAPLVAGLGFFSVVAIGIAGMSAWTQQPLLYMSAGLTAQSGATILGISAGMAMAGAGLIGWIVDRYPPVIGVVFVAITHFLSLAIFFALPTAPTFAFGVVAGSLIGFTCGAAEILWITLFRRHFGTALFPLAYGAWYFLLQAGYGSGGGISGAIVDFGGRTPLIAALAAIYILPTLVGALISLRKPNRQ